MKLKSNQHLKMTKPKGKKHYKKVKEAKLDEIFSGEILNKLAQHEYRFKIKRAKDKKAKKEKEV